MDVFRRNVVILGGHREVGPTDRTSAHAEPVEGLGAGDLVNEMKIDVEQVCFARCAVHDMCIPHLLGECLWLTHDGSFLSQLSGNKNPVILEECPRIGTSDFRVGPMRGHMAT